MEYSPQFGAASANGTNTQIINIDHPEEYLIGVSVDFPSDACIFVRPLRFHTNVRQYDWTQWSSYCCSSSNFQIDGRRRVVGFHGHASSTKLHSIRVYVFNLVDDIFKDCVPRYPGPWGGCGGRHWDDGVFSAVKQIHVHVSAFVCIRGIQFEYLGRDGRSTWSPCHGANFVKPEKIEIKCKEEEVLIGVAGFYGRVKGSGEIEVIKSLSFYTNKRLFGPYGDENGNHFTSMACRNGKVVGFRGSSSGAYLNSIGLHLEYV